MRKENQPRDQGALRHLGGAVHHLSGVFRHLSGVFLHLGGAVHLVDALHHFGNALHHLSAAFRQLSGVFRHLLAKTMTMLGKIPLNIITCLIMKRSKCVETESFSFYALGLL